MDPNECLKEIREAIQIFCGSGNDGQREHAAETVVFGLADLDEWLSRGGFLPDAWATARERGIQIGHGNTQINTF